jgi:hypothetical protein
VEYKTPHDEINSSKCTSSAQRMEKYDSKPMLSHSRVLRFTMGRTSGVEQVEAQQDERTFVRTR